MKRMIALLVIPVALLGIAVFITFEIRGLQKGITAESDPGVVAGMLIMSDRSHLSVCVDGAASAAVDSAVVEMVRQATEDGLLSVDGTFDRAEEYRQGLHVVNGCPPATAALTPDQITEQSRRFGDILGEPVHATTPASISEHRVHVYLLPQRAYQSAFGEKSYALGAAEFLCSGGVCAEVTAALYVPETATPPTLSDGLLDAIGFLPATRAGDPPFDRQEAEEERQRGAGLIP